MPLNFRHHHHNNQRFIPCKFQSLRLNRSENIRELTLCFGLYCFLYRKCQLVTTGPWKEVPNLRLIDISIQCDVDQNYDGPIAVWAVGANGDVVTRMGVTVDNPEVNIFNNTIQCF